MTKTLILTTPNCVPSRTISSNCVDYLTSKDLPFVKSKLINASSLTYVHEPQNQSEYAIERSRKTQAEVNANNKISNTLTAEQLGWADVIVLMAPISQGISSKYVRRFFEILDNDFEFGFLNNKAVTIMSASKSEAHKNVQSIANIYTRLIQFGLNVVTPNEPSLLHIDNQIHRLGFQYQHGQPISKDHQKIIHHQLSRALKFSAFFNAPQTNILRSTSNAS